METKNSHDSFWELSTLISKTITWFSEKNPGKLGCLRVSKLTEETKRTTKQSKAVEANNLNDHFFILFGNGIEGLTIGELYGFFVRLAPWKIHTRGSEQHVKKYFGLKDEFVQREYIQCL